MHHPGPGAWVSMIMLLEIPNSLVDSLFGRQYAVFSALSGPGGLPSYCNLVAFVFPRQFVVYCIIWTLEPTFLLQSSGLVHNLGPCWSINPMPCDLSRFRSFLSRLYFAANLDPEAETCFFSSATWWFGASSGPWSQGFNDHASRYSKLPR